MVLRSARSKTSILNSQMEHLDGPGKRNTKSSRQRGERTQPIFFLHARIINERSYSYNSSFRFGSRGGGIRRLTSRQKIQGYQYQKERLIRHTGQSGHGSGDSGPKWLARPRPENHAEEKSPHPQRRGLRRNPSSGLKEKSPTL